MKNLRVKFLIAFSVMVGMIAAISIIADNSLDHVYHGVKVVKEEYKELNLLYDLQTLLHEQVSSANKYLLTHDRKEIYAYEKSRGLFKIKFDQFKKISGSEKEPDDEHEETEKKLIENIHGKLTALDQAIQTVFSLPENAAEKESRELLKRIYDSFEIFNTSIRSFREEDLEEFKKATLTARQVEKESNSVLWVTSCIALLLGSVFIVFFSRSILGPITKLYEGVSLISKGNFDTRVEIDSTDEIGKLAAAYNTMAIRLKESYMLLENKVKERTSELEESNENLQNLFNGITDAIFVLDKNYHIVNANKSAAILFETTPDRLEGIHCYELFNEQDGVCNTCPVHETFKTGKTAHRFKEWKRPTGKMYFELNAFPMAGRKGAVTHVIEHIRDITEKKDMQERLMRSEKLSAIGELAAGVAHEINTPLATIAGCSEGLISRMSSNNFIPDEESKDFTDYLKTIDEEAYHCKTIISQLLDFSRKTEPKFEKIEVHELLFDVINSIKKQKGLEKVFFKTFFFKEKLYITADSSQLKQVFYNIIGNAVDAVKNEGNVSITTSRDEGEARILFTDNGCGFSTDILAKAFDPFFTTKPPGQGTGLGLSLCYGIVEQHGGQIKVTSDGEGCGAEIEIILPMDNKNNNDF